jgi:hypothetical protein
MDASDDAGRADVVSGETLHRQGKVAVGGLISMTRPSLKPNSMTQILLSTNTASMGFSRSATKLGDVRLVGAARRRELNHR